MSGLVVCGTQTIGVYRSSNPLHLPQDCHNAVTRMLSSGERAVLIAPKKAIHAYGELKRRWEDYN